MLLFNQYLDLFSKKDLKKVSILIENDFFGHNEKVKKLFFLLIKEDGMYLAKAKILQYLFPEIEERKKQDSNFNRVKSELLSIFKNYLCMEGILSNPLLKEEVLLQELLKFDQEEVFGREVRASERRIQKLSERSSNFYKGKWCLAELKRQFIQKNYLPDQVPFGEMIHDLDLFVLLEKLKYACFSLESNNKNRFNDEDQEALENLLATDKSKQLISLSPPAEIYFHLFQALKQKKEDQVKSSLDYVKYFEGTIRSLFIANMDCFNQREKVELAVFIGNGLAQSDYLSSWLEEVVNPHKLFLDGKHIPPKRFIKQVFSALRGVDTGQARKYFKNYQHYLSENYRPFIMILAEGAILFNEKDYEKAFEVLSRGKVLFKAPEYKAFFYEYCSFMIRSAIKYDGQDADYYVEHTLNEMKRRWYNKDRKLGSVKGHYYFNLCNFLFKIYDDRHLKRKSKSFWEEKIEAQLHPSHKNFAQEVVLQWY